MTKEEFEGLVEKMKGLAEKSPGLYRLKVALFALLGYSFILTIVVIPLILVALMVFFIMDDPREGVLLAIPLALLIFVVIKIFWVRINQPMGFPLKRADDDRLHQMIAEIKEELKTPGVDQIILTDQLNMTLYQYPRLGFFGFNKNYFVIGLPMMMVLSKEELKSVIVHELAHMSDKHSKFRNMIYYLKIIFIKVMKGIQKRDQIPRGTLILKKFLGWYIPILDGYTFALMRDHEYQTDQLAASVTTPSTMASALTKINIAAIYFDKIFWNKIFKKSKEHPKPINYVYFRMDNDLKEELDKEKIDKMLERVLSRKSHSFDIHPALADRVKALGVVENQIYFGEDSLESLFKNKEFYLNKLSQVWEKSVLDWWEEQYHNFGQAREQLTELEKKEEVEGLNKDEEFEKATLIEKLEDREKALDAYYDILEDKPDFSPVLFSIGRILLANEVDEGEEFIEEAMKYDHRSTIEGCRLLHNYMVNKGDLKRAKQYYQKAQNYQDVVEDAKEERKRIGLSDTYHQHQLSDDKIEEIKEKIKGLSDIYNQIEEVYLVRKGVKYLKDHPLYVLGVKFSDINVENQSELVEQLVNKEIGISGDLYVVPLHEKNKKIEEIIKEVDGADILST